MSELETTNTAPEGYHLTPIELDILKLIDKKYKWMARDADNKLFLFAQKPSKDKSSHKWDGPGEAIEFSMFSDYVFENIKWEDTKPVKIQKAIEQEVLTQMLETLFGGEDELE